MKEIELTLPPNIDLVIVEQVIEQCCASQGLTQSLKGALKKYPESLHWHFKQERQRGTLEITFWPKAGQIRFKVQEGRQAPWIEEIVSTLPGRIAQELTNVAGGGSLAVNQR